MTLNELNIINKDTSFIESRLQSQKDLLLILSIGGACIVGLWQLLDRFCTIQHPKELFWLRTITIMVYMVNLSIGLCRKKPLAYKQHLIAGFYFGTTYCMLLSMFTGASTSPYWYGLFFILIAWFILMPYGYKEMFIHGTVFIFMFVIGSYAQRIYPLIPSEMTKILFVYSGVLFLGIFSAISKNKSDAANYRSKFNIKEANEELQAANEELRTEIENHHLTTLQLIEKQQFIENILSNAPIIIWSIDLDGNFTYSQGKGLQEMSLTSFDRIGKSALEIYKGTPVADFVKKVIAGEATNEIIHYKDWIFDTRVTALFNSDGEKTGYMGVALNIAERIQTEKKLAKFKLVLDQAPGAVFIMDKDSNFEYINPYFTKMSGYTEEDLLHKNIYETLYHGKTPESRKDVIKALQTGTSWQGELLTLNKDGNTYWANTIAAPFKNDKGILDGYIIIQQDVTEQKKMINALKEREHLHRTLIEDSLEGVTITQDFKFIFVNQVFSNMIGYSLEELNDIGPTSIIAPEDRDRVVEYHNMRMKGEKGPRTYIADFIRKDGTRFTAEMNSSGVEINGKQASYISMRNITEKLRMEEALRNSEKRYRELTEMLPQTIYELDLNGNISYMNQTGLKMFGVSKSVIGLPAFNFIIPEQHEKMRLNMSKSIHNNYYTPGNDYTAIRNDGTTFPVMIFASPLISEGIVTGTRGIILDMTEHIAMEDALRLSELKYKTLVENSQDGICIIQNNKFKFVNSAICRMLGYTAEELYKLEGQDVLFQEDRERVLKIHQDRMEGKISSYAYGMQLVKKDKTIIYVETQSSTVEYEGSPAGFMTLHDITESKKIQAALIESEAKYRELVETTNSIILKWDKNYNITFLNEYGLKFFGFTREEIINQPVVGTIVPHSEEMNGRNLTVLMHDIFTNPKKYEQNINENIRKNGERVWISWNNTAIRDENGKISNMFSVGTDITERRKNEEELRITKDQYEKLNLNLEKKVKETAKKLTEANTLLIRLQKENLQSQFEVLRQQVNPHFLFNSLNVLTSLIKLEPDLAEKFTEHLSKVYRYVLENKDNDLVSLYTELDFLDAYLFLLNIRFMDKIKVEITIEENIKDCLILPLALQLIIENAIKHNTMSKKAPLVIQLFIDENFMLNIVNNLQEREDQMASTGVGLKNISHRYELLEMPAPEFYKTKTQFIAKIPLKEKE